MRTLLTIEVTASDDGNGCKYDINLDGFDDYRAAIAALGHVMTKMVMDEETDYKDVFKIDKSKDLN